MKDLKRTMIVATWTLDLDFMLVSETLRYVKLLKFNITKTKYTISKYIIMIILDKTILYDYIHVLHIYVNIKVLISVVDENTNVQC